MSVAIYGAFSVGRQRLCKIGGIDAFVFRYNSAATVTGVCPINKEQHWGEKWEHGFQDLKIYGNYGLNIGEKTTYYYTGEKEGFLQSNPEARLSVLRIFLTLQYALHATIGLLLSDDLDVESIDDSFEQLLTGKEIDSIIEQARAPVLRYEFQSFDALLEDGKDLLFDQIGFESGLIYEVVVTPWASGRSTVTTPPATS